MNKYDKIFDWYTINEAFEICHGKVMKQIERKLDHDEKKFLDNVVKPFEIRWDAINQIETSFLGFKYSGVSVNELTSAIRYFQKINQLENDLNYVDPSNFKSGGFTSAEQSDIMVSSHKAGLAIRDCLLRLNGKNVNPNHYI